MRSVIIKDSHLNQCGICQESGQWIKLMNMDGIEFIYCYKCHTITFKEDIDFLFKKKIENKMNIKKKEDDL